ncbi:MAG: GNAT family N-acetyltransferase [Oscillospiraceae bacterium]|nr:GNAT family N-acetyltransferase [Oscillospiraceae bacterium]
MLDEIENEVKRLGGTSISLSAQLRVKKFYELSGYQASGDIYFDEYCEHIHMEKIL